jgi:hypothetical protein
VWLEHLLSGATESTRNDKVLHRKFLVFPIFLRYREILRRRFYISTREGKTVSPFIYLFIDILGKRHLSNK